MFSLRKRRLKYFSNTIFYKVLDLSNKIEEYNNNYNSTKQPNLKKRFNFKTYSRNCTILPICLGYNFLLYNGKSFNNVYIIENILEHKLGEFCTTRQRYIYRRKKKKKKK